MADKQLSVFDIPPKVVIESCCSTQRAAELVNVSTATLNRAKREGKMPYRSQSWEVYCLSQNSHRNCSWQVLFSVQR
jgi:hypothetical protein